MGLEINSIITLENKERYVVLNETMYEGNKYFLVMGVDSKDEIISTKVAILHEVVQGNELFVERVIDQDLIITLTRILKSQI